MAGKVQKTAVVEFKEEAVYWSSTVLWVAGNGHVNRECLLPYIALFDTALFKKMNILFE